MALILLDDATARTFEPFALTRPLGELRFGALLLRERWEQVAGSDTMGQIGSAHLTDFVEESASLVLPPDASIPAGTIVANTRCVAALDARLDDADLWLCEGLPAAVRLPTATSAGALGEGAWPPTKTGGVGARRRELRGRWLTHVWDLIRGLQTQLADDLAILGPMLDTELTPQADVVAGPPGAVLVERGATVEPYTVFDTTAGPVLVRRGASVLAFTRVVGPCVIGEGSSVAGGGNRISGCAIGPHCRVHGEMSASVVLGYSNKSHDGFVGHSYVGAWVNLGAGTVTSNLKNTYGPVQMLESGTMRNTEMMFLGSMIGDYARTGIGTRLNTGAVVGAGANIFPAGLSPKVVPPFAWGDAADPFARFELDKFLAVATRQMARRNVVLDDRGRRYLTAVYRRATGA
jgi:UDP-N-acetylglucosamine diphosphorylase/glucosamine-1-phosphate N-acetyltransferase